MTLDEAALRKSKPRALGCLWIGAQLGPTEQLCLLSFLEHGHDIALYVYEPVAGVPPGVQVIDAREVYDVQTIQRYKKSQSPSLHSNLFRYALLAKTSRMWVDLDLFCLRPFVFASDYVYGQEDATTVNTAALSLPTDSEALQQLLSYKPGDKGFPPFFSFGRKLRYFIKHGGRKPDITEWPWGATGPRGLTYHLKQTGDLEKALPVQSFYPVPLSNLSDLLEPGKLKRADFGNDVFAIHLWASQLRKLLLSDYQGQIPDGSFLQVEMSRLGEKFQFPLALRVH